MDKKSIIGIGIMVALGIVLLFSYVYYYSHQSCSVGYRGSAATITFQGGTAPSQCDSTVNQDLTHYYHYTGEPTGTELCAGNFGGNQYTVRDTGLLDIVGSE